MPLGGRKRSAANSGTADPWIEGPSGKRPRPNTVRRFWKWELQKGVGRASSLAREYPHLKPELYREFCEKLYTWDDLRTLQARLSLEEIHAVIYLLLCLYFNLHSPKLRREIKSKQDAEGLRYVLAQPEVIRLPSGEVEEILPARKVKRKEGRPRGRTISRTSSGKIISEVYEDPEEFHRQVILHLLATISQRAGKRGAASWPLIIGALRHFVADAAPKIIRARVEPDYEVKRLRTALKRFRKSQAYPLTPISQLLKRLERKVRCLLSDPSSIAHFLSTFPPAI